MIKTIFWITLIAVSTLASEEEKGYQDGLNALKNDGIYRANVNIYEEQRADGLLYGEEAYREYGALITAAKMRCVVLVGEKKIENFSDDYCYGFSKGCKDGFFPVSNMSYSDFLNETPKLTTYNHGYSDGEKAINNDDTYMPLLLTSIELHTIKNERELERFKKETCTSLINELPSNATDKYKQGFEKGCVDKISATLKTKIPAPQSSENDRTQTYEAGRNHGSETIKKDIALMKEIELYKQTRRKFDFFKLQGKIIDKCQNLSRQIPRNASREYKRGFRDGCEGICSM